jgi:hypothetical protein
MQKILTMPIELDITPGSIKVPGQPRPQPIHGIIRWSVPDWDKAEYANILTEVNKLISTCFGKELYEVVEHLANLLEKRLPDRNFSISIGSFGIERKIETKKDEGG